MRSERTPDYILLFITAALAAIGIIMVMSASPAMAIALGDAMHYLKRHLFHIFLGAAFLFLGLNLSILNLKKWAGSMLLAAIFLLLLVYIPGIGRTAGGASRWIDLFGFSFQPSEIAKFAVILFFAKAISQRAEEENRGSLAGFFALLTILAFVILIILRQPDLGTSLMVAATALSMFFVGGEDMKRLVITLAAAAGAFFIAALSSPYRIRRLTAFLRPWDDPSDAGFHIIQSLFAVGSGGIFGLGLGMSRQKFFYLPQHTTDFIYAILCEELGFMGGASVIFLFVLFAVRGFRIARFAPDRFSALLCYGITFWIILQAAVNIAVVLGFLPTTGIPLPFVSFGGTSMIVSLFSVGILMNVSKYLTSERDKKKQGEAK